VESWDILAKLIWLAHQHLHRQNRNRAFTRPLDSKLPHVHVGSSKVHFHTRPESSQHRQLQVTHPDGFASRDFSGR
jgi:hypothetical protein